MREAARLALALAWLSGCTPPAPGEQQPPPTATPAPLAVDVPPPYDPPLPPRGRGLAFTEKYGGAALDFPGPGALLAPPGVPGRTITRLAPGQETCGGPGLTAVELDGAGDAVEALRSGADLVLLGERPEAAGAVRRWRERGHLAVQTMVLSPPSLAGLGDAMGDADLVGWTEEPSAELRALLTPILRRLGRRPVLHVREGLSEPEVLDAIVEGEVLQADGPLGARILGAVEAARARPSWFQRDEAQIVLLVPSSALRGRDGALARWLIGAVVALDRAHLPWRPALASDSGLTPRDASPSRRVGEVAFLLPPASLLTGAEQRWMEGWRAERVALSPDRAPLLRGVGPPSEVPGPAALRRALEALLSAPENQPLERSTALLPADLPPGLRVRRFVDAADDRVVFHLIGQSPGGQELLVADLLAHDRSRCAARSIDPWTRQEVELPCTADPRVPTRAAVTLPSVDGWRVVEVERRPETRLPAAGGRWAVEVGHVDRVEGRTVTLRPPDGPLSTLSLSLPEWLKGAGGLEEALADGRSSAREDPVDGRVIVRTVGPRVRFEGEVRGRVDGVDIELRVANLGPDRWTDVRALICVAAGAPGGAWPFPREGQEHMRGRFSGVLRPLAEARLDSGDPLYIELRAGDAPVTALGSVDGRLNLALGMDRSDLVGGNANGGICLHARPRLGDIGPGEEASARGSLLLSAGPDSPLFEARWVGAGGGAGDPFQAPWSAPCSREGRRFRETRPPVPLPPSGAAP